MSRGDRPCASPGTRPHCEAGRNPAWQTLREDDAERVSTGAVTKYKTDEAVSTGGPGTIFQIRDWG